MTNDPLDRFMRPSPEGTGQAAASIGKVLVFVLKPKRFAIIAVVVLVIGAAQNVHGIVLLLLGALCIWGGRVLQRRGL